MTRRDRGARPSALAALLAACLLATQPAAHGAAVASGSGDSRPGILVELFTSQGCSSCPPADRYLSELAQREDAAVIALSFHVDYWNYIGWTDPFSSAAWSERQRGYARALGDNRVYTPQIVVAGRWEGVGSDRAEVSRLLDRARSLPRGAELELDAELLADDGLRLTVRLRGSGSGLAGRSPDVWVAVVENGLVTAVGRGENARKSLRNDRVVRRLERVRAFDALDADSAQGVIELAVEAGWRRQSLSLVAFVQDAETLRVLAAAECALPGRA